MTNTVLIVAEAAKESAAESSLELLSAARDLAGETGTVVAACLGATWDEDALAGLIAHGADRIVIVDDSIFDPGQADPWVRELAAIAGEAAADFVLLSHSPLGADVAPRLAFRLHTAVVMGCISFEHVDGIVRWTRPCFGGNAREVLSVSSSPVVATIAARAFNPLPGDGTRTGVVERRSAVSDLDQQRVRVSASAPIDSTRVGLDTARVVVSGGRGLGGPAGFEQAAELAEMLDAAVGASRVACDLGWCPASWQVGLSGKTVAPDLYLAFGISGAAQHLAGCAGAKTIVAVNNDPDAEIFSASRYGIVADCSEFLPALIEALRRHRSERA